MQQYIGFFITLAFIFIIVVFNKYLFWWVKSIIITYYLAVSYFFITVRMRFEKEDKGVLPAPDAYWVENSERIDTITNYLFFPLIGIIIFIYYKWFTNAQTKKAKLLILLSIIPSVILLNIFSFSFSFSYGY